MKKTRNFLPVFIAVGFMITMISCNKDNDPSKTDDVTSYEGYKLIWNDEFNGAAIDPANWNYETGNGTDYGLPAGWGNNEKQIYTNNTENSSIQADETASVLAITALADNSGGYTSAKLTSENLFSMRFGRVDIRAKLPIGRGIWPAFWMMGDNRDLIKWPGCGEIDIIEVLGHEPSKLYSTLHFTDKDNEHGEIQNIHVLGSGDFSEAYHLFTLDWTPDSLIYSLDGQYLRGFGIEDDMKEFLRSTYLILNIAVGGYWPGDPNETTVFPQTMYVDYIRVYSQDGFVAPAAPELILEEETVGQIIEPNIADNGIRHSFNDFGSLEVISYGPGSPLISASDTAIDGGQSLVFDFPGGGWGGAYLEMAAAKDLSKYAYLKFALNKPSSLVNAEIKLESRISATNAILYLKNYSGVPLSDGFTEYSIPMADFAALTFTDLTIPFAMWNPQDAAGKFVKARVLIDDIRFE